MVEERSQLNIRVDKDTLTRLGFIATIEGTTTSDLVRRAVLDLIESYATDPDFQERRQHWLDAVQGTWDKPRPPAG